MLCLAQMLVRVHMLERLRSMVWEARFDAHDALYKVKVLLGGHLLVGKVFWVVNCVR